MLVPLSLRAKLYIYPWAMAVIVAVTMGFSIKDFIDQDKFEKKTHEWNTRHDLYNTSFQLLRAGCVHFFAISECKVISENMNPDMLFQLNQLNQVIDLQAGIAPESKNKMKEFFRRLPEQLSLREDILGELKEFRRFRISFESVRAEAKAFQEEHNILTRDNVNSMSIFFGQLTHHSWTHLLGNMLVLILFSLYLEQRVGHIFFTIIYFGAGTMGLGLEALFLKPNAFLMGSSANIMGILGAFLFFFGRENLDYHMNLFFLYRQRITLPSWAFIGVFVGLSNGLYAVLYGVDTLAVMAHFTGMAGGVFLAFLASQLYWVRDGFLFIEEQRAFLKAKQTNQPVKKIKYSLEILEINHTSFIAVDYIFRTLAKHNVEIQQLEQKTQKKIANIILRLLHGEYDVKTSQVIASLSLIPLSWNLSFLPIKTLDQNDLAAIDDILIGNDWRIAIRFYDLYLSEARSPQVVDAMVSTVQKIIVNADSPLNSQFHQNIEWMKRYGILHSNTTLGRILNDKYPPTKAA